MIAPDDRRHEPAVARDEERGLRRPFRPDPEVGRERGDRRRTRCRDLLERTGFLRIRIRPWDRRHLPVRRVAAGLAEDEDVLPGRVQHHELVGLGAAHDPDVARDDHGLEPEPLEDPDVRALLGLVARVEPHLVAVRAVGILHDELADADQAGPGARLVAPFCLEVVEHHGQLAIGLDDVGQQQPDDLLVGHRQDHVPAIAILEPGQLGADRVVAPAGPPDVGRVDDRHLDLLGADPIHLLADHLLDALVDLKTERQQRIDARSELAHVTGPKQQPVRRHLGFARIVAKRCEEQLRQTHRRRIAAPLGPHPIHPDTVGPCPRI
jgi:hypothetical protein